ncbi:MAG: twin-arginine translocation signal domain-containing protein, partial [Gemmatimonadales bacterium]
MFTNISRRKFIGASAGAAGAAMIKPQMLEAASVIVRRGRPLNPIAVASANGIRGVARAAELMAQGMNTLDAAIEGVKIQELDPNDRSVGYGGLP